jgi:hypothetical protein
MQVRVQDNTAELAMLKGRRLADKQARLGIIANDADVTLPFLPPRDVWTRWPKLHSARRQKRATHVSCEQKLAQDCVLNGAMLDAFTREIRDPACDERSAQVAILDTNALLDDIKTPIRRRLQMKGAQVKGAMFGALIVMMLGLVARALM